MDQFNVMTINIFFIFGCTLDIWGRIVCEKNIIKKISPNEFKSHFLPSGEKNKYFFINFFFTKRVFNT